MALYLASLEKALASLELALNAYNTTQALNDSVEKEIMRDGVIQRFEYTFELSWKMLKRYLEEYGLEKPDSFTNKELFRVGFESGLILDPENWFVYMKNHNLTSHTYEEKIAKQVYESAKIFLHDARYLLNRLKDKTQ